MICTDETVADAVLRADSLMYIAKNRKNIVIIENDENVSKEELDEIKCSETTLEYSRHQMVPSV